MTGIGGDESSSKHIGRDDSACAQNLTSSDAVAERAIAAGAKEVFPIADQPYGLRQGRVEDPFGHHWLIGTPL